MFNRSVNKVVLVGNLGKDPELRALSTGSSVVNLTLATQESWKNKQTGERQEKTEWHRLVVYGPLAELCSQYLRKGMKIYVDGRIQTQKWKDKMTGEDRYSTSIVVSELELLESSKMNVVSNNNTLNQSDSYSPTLNEPSLSKKDQTLSWGEKPRNIKDNAVNANDEFFDDDIPF